LAWPAPACWTQLTDADGQLVEVSVDFLICGLDTVGLVVHCFWEKFGWCKGMMFEFEATNNNCQFPCLIVYDDGEEEKVDLPDDTVKVFDGMHECAGDPL
jgi:hypothetical protein